MPKDSLLSVVRGKLYTNFLTWMKGKHGGELTSTVWRDILNEDDSWSGTWPVVVTQSQAQN
jgi:hypothetical protein